ncbi:hypothetical protein ABZ252_04535 [Streptomyces sp. NPDC006175]|uniref:hypothetical protein n=1 Tax=Streptomyces sp. NPDC006175 TaxID=3154471 RepID=UPI0033AFA7AE
MGETGVKPSTCWPRSRPTLAAGARVARTKACVILAGTLLLINRIVADAPYWEAFYPVRGGW